MIPLPDNYRGKLFILTSGATGSTCEPIVYSLKQRGRAVIVGETTAGAMLTGEFFNLNEGFRLFMPTADYYTSDGYHIDRQGVMPTIKTKAAEALDYMLQQLSGIK